MNAAIIKNENFKERTVDVSCYHLTLLLLSSLLKGMLEACQTLHYFPMFTISINKILRQLYTNINMSNFHYRINSNRNFNFTDVQTR